MRQRSISAVGVIVACLVPAFLGGPIWALAIAIFATVGMTEFDRFVEHLGFQPLRIGYLAIWLGCLIAAAGWSTDIAMLSLAVVLIVSSLAALKRNNGSGSMVAWAMDLAGAIYLGLPAYLAIQLRRIEGDVSRNWLASTSDSLALDWNGFERGLAWLLFVIVVTWLSDTGAYMLGRTFGRTPLFPSVSPKKTREGLAGGLIAAVLFGLLANELLGLDLPVLVAAVVAMLLATLGVFGDLIESLMKRQANVKDSGTLIPGHGGMLDRIDALLFTWTAGYFLARFCDRYWG